MIYAGIENADRFRHWIANRGGIAVWRSAENLDKRAYSPALRADGSAVSKPYGWCIDEPSEIVTDPAQVVLSEDVEVGRVMRVGIRAGDQSQAYKFTDGGLRRINAAVAKAGPGAYYTFDCLTRQATIMLPRRTTTLDAI